MRGLGKRGTWIVGGIALVLVTIVAISDFLSYTNAEKAIIDKFQERQALAADTSAKSIESYFEGLARETRALATSRIVRTFDKQAVKHEIGLELKELEELGVNDIRVLDADGIVKFSASEPGVEGRNFSSGRYFIKARQAKSSSESNYDIEAGSNLVLYTDGLLDTRRDKEFFGEIGIFKALSTIESKESDRVVSTLIEAAMDFAQGQLSDDIAIISIRFLE